MIVLLGIFSIAFLSLTFCSSESGICFTGSPPILSDMLSSESVLLYMILVSVCSWKSSLLNKFLLNPKIQEVTRTRLIQMYKVTHVLMQLSWEKLCLPSWLCWPGASPYQIRVQQKARRWLEQLSVWHVTICNGSVLSARYVTAVNTAVGHSLVVGGGGVTDCYNTRTIAVGAVAATTTETLPGVAAAVGLSIWHWKMTLESLCYEPIPPSEQLPHHATS